MNWTWGAIAYAALCVLVPVGWGVLVVWMSNWVERRVRRPGPTAAGRRARPPVRPIEYHI